MTRRTGSAVRIYRPKNFLLQWGQDRLMTVFVDGEKRGEIWTNQVKTFDIAPGRHEVRLGTGWGWLHRSSTLSFEVGVGEIADFACPRFWSGSGWARLRPATETDLAGMSRLQTESPIPRNLAEQTGPDSDQL